MKLKKNILFKNKLTKLKLIENKIYTNSFESCFKTTEVTSKLKKSLNIIYKYHLNNKKILFIGTSNKISKSLTQIFKNTKHILLPRSIWMNGIITNRSSCLKFLRKNKNSLNKKFYETLFQLNKKVDLIVMLDSYYKDNILNEGYIANIPTVFLGKFLNNLNSKPSYRITGNFQFLKKKIRDNIFYSLLVASLKKRI